MLRYGTGGRQMGSKGAGNYHQGRAYGNGLSNYRGTRESSMGAIQSQFRLDWDVENLKRALNRVGVDGDKYVKGVLHEAANMAISKVRRMLKNEQVHTKVEKFPRPSYYLRNSCICT